MNPLQRLPVVAGRILLCLLVSLLACVSVSAQTYTPKGQRLRTLADTNDLWIGCSVGLYGFNDVDYLGIAGAEYNLITPEDGFKFKSVEPSQNSFSFTSGDQIVAVAQSQGADIHGHTLVWYYGNPTWLTSGTWTPATLTSVMYNHIDRVMTHWSGQIAMWDVVNEAIDGSKSNADWKQNLRSNDIWNSIIGPTYIELAFLRARQADPNALLVYNDYDQEQLNNKSNTMYRMMSDFVSRGIPVDAVGFQCHWLTATPDFNSFAANLDRFAKLGLQIFLTEFDTDSPNGSTAITPNAANDLQARIYYNCLDKALRCPAVAGFQCWGVTDRYSWRGYWNYPLPFDSYYLGYQAKPAYYGIQDALAVQYRKPLTTNSGFESGTGSWTNNGTGTLSVVSTDPHSGTNAIKISGRSGAWGGPTQDITTAILAQGSGRYYAGCWMKATTGTLSGRLLLQLTDSEGVHYTSINQTVGTTWTRVGGWINLGWYKTLSNAKLIVQTASGTADFYADDIKVSDGNIAANGHFEEGTTGWIGSGTTLFSTTADPQYHYGAKGLGCTGRTSSTQGPQQNILGALLAEGPGNYNFQAYMKLATGTASGKIGVKLTYGGSDYYITTATASLNATGWTKVSSIANVNVTWSSPLTAAVLYIETPGTVNDFYADEVLMRK